MKKNVIIGILTVLAIAIIVAIVLMSRSSNTGENEIENNANGNKNLVPSPQGVGKPLNITILLDLSDRITKSNNPSNTERDIAIVKHVISKYKNDISQRRVVLMDGCLKVLFYPTPDDPSMATLANDLEISVSKNTQNLTQLATTSMLEDKFEKNLRTIYEKALKQNKWPGCDIWNFIKNKQNLYMKDANYRNILVIVTDGYVYHQNARFNSKKRYSYLLGSNIAPYRDPVNYNTKIQNDDFGLISTKNDLSGLEVLVLEVNPEQGKPVDYDIIKLVLSNWFKEMGASKCEVYQTDLPSNTKVNIDKFFK
ncbi:MAG: hypothetical protein J5542_12000 [Bacteroidales bacterium]|nr:hypothetical protein [Bacteroidales bacterium]